MSTSFRTLLVASGMMTWAAADASAAEYQCRKQDSSLRIAVEVKKAGHTLPCEVIVEDDRGERAVLYSAQFDRDYCPGRIEKTRGELEQEGWSCRKTSDDNIVKRTDEDDPAEELAGEPAPVRAAGSAGRGSTLVAGDDRVITASHQCRLGDDLRRIHVEVEDAARGKPCELIYWENGDDAAPGEVLWRAEHDAAFCPNRLNVIIGKWISEGWQCDAGGLQNAAAEAPRETTEPEAVADQALAVQNVRSETVSEAEAPVVDADAELEAIIAADAERIGDWMEVDPDVEVAARGDLNNDGTDDAVVFLAYQSDQAVYRQYLMSYLVADKGYELASVKLLTGVGPPPAQARVTEIDEGVIWLTLPRENGSTPAPTGYRLRNQELVEVEPKAPAEGDN